MFDICKSYTKRKRNLALGLGMVAAMLHPGLATAADFPSRPITIVIPGAAGGGIDTTIRLLEPKLRELLGQPVVVQPVPGASGNTGTSFVARAAADGYTILAMAASQTVNPSTMDVPYDLIADFTPVSLLVKTSSMLVSHPSVPANTLEELIAYSKENPGAMTYGSVGVGSMPHLQMELLREQAGIDILHVPYPGNGPALNDVLAGHIDMMILNAHTALPHVEAGALRAYGVTSAERVPAAPDVPTLSEAGLPGYEALQWFGLIAPAGTPPDAIDKLYQAVSAAMNDADLQAQFNGSGSLPSPSESPEAFGEFIKSELSKWATAVADLAAP